jgi:hypothetical protein
MEQNLKNHSRYVPVWHFVTALLLLALTGGSIVNFIQADDQVYYSAALLVIVSLILWIVWWYARAFALRAQDRAIRAEENFRHHLLTGKPLDSQLRMSQVIALRFASDEEFPTLAKRAVEEKLSARQIKEAIKNWKGDFYRV